MGKSILITLDNAVVLLLFITDMNGHCRRGSVKIFAWRSWSLSSDTPSSQRQGVTQDPWRCEDAKTLDIHTYYRTFVSETVATF